VGAKILSMGCRRPASEFVVPYCFGDLTDAERDRFEQHLLSCDECWKEVQRLEASVRVLRTEQRLKGMLLSADVMGIFGMSGHFDLPFAGHRGFLVLASMLYAALYAIPVLVEIAYQFDIYGAAALRIAPVVFAWVFGTTLFAFWLHLRDVRRSGQGFLLSITVLLGATALLCIAIAPWFPTEHTVDAHFQTYTARAGYFKSVVYAWLVFLPFVVWPFHFVLMCQRELKAGRFRALLALFSGQKPAVAPRGTLYPRFAGLTAFLALLGAISWAGTNHMFENLKPSPHMNLFMWLVMARVVTWLVLATVALAWYAMMLNELKRECLMLASGEVDQPAASNGGLRPVR
jgi:amino acid transporter